MSWIAFFLGAFSGIMMAVILAASHTSYAISVCDEVNAPKKCVLEWVAK